MKINRTFIIAEAGVNHNGSLNMAKKLIDAAVDAGADAVKFQTFKTEDMASYRSPTAEYQKIARSVGTSQHQLLKKLELDQYAHEALIEYCRLREIQFLSTAFDLGSLDMLTKVFKLPRIKVPSGEITNGPLLLHAARTSKPILLSTGMSTIREIENALGVIAFGYLKRKERPSAKAFRIAFSSQEGQAALRRKVTLLHCTSEYPAPANEINLRAMETMRTKFNLPVGFSDHSKGIYAAVAAVALGAIIIEKHFTLDKNLPGPDHRASLEPRELKEMILAIREVEISLGIFKKIPMPSELKNREIVRKSLVAGRPIKKNEHFSMENLRCKRPGYGLSPMSYWDIIGKSAKKNYKKDEPIMVIPTGTNEDDIR